MLLVASLTTLSACVVDPAHQASHAPAEKRQVADVVTLVSCPTPAAVRVPPLDELAETNEPGSPEEAGLFFSRETGSFRATLYRNAAGSIRLQFLGRSACKHLRAREEGGPVDAVVLVGDVEHAEDSGVSFSSALFHVLGVFSSLHLSGSDSVRSDGVDRPHEVYLHAHSCIAQNIERHFEILRLLPDCDQR